jgi:hypothetical protein
MDTIPHDPSVSIREIIRLLSESRRSHVPLLLTRAAQVLGFYTASRVDGSVNDEYQELLDTLQNSLEAQYRSREEWLSTWWYPSVFAEFTSVLFESAWHACSFSC